MMMQKKKHKKNTRKQWVKIQSSVKIPQDAADTFILINNVIVNE